MSTNLPGNLPVFSEIDDPKASKNVRHVLRDCLSNDAVFNEVVPFMVNGGVCGHKVMDLAAVVDVIVAHDHANGNRLSVFKLNKKALGDAAKAVLRERYELDKGWKIVGKSHRVLLASPAAS